VWVQHIVSHIIILGILLASHSHISWGTPDLQTPLDPVNCVFGTIPMYMRFDMVCMCQVWRRLHPRINFGRAKLWPKTQLTESIGVWRSVVPQLKWDILWRVNWYYCDLQKCHCPVFVWFCNMSSEVLMRFIKVINLGFQTISWY